MKNEIKVGNESVVLDLNHPTLQKDINAGNLNGGELYTNLNGISFEIVYRSPDDVRTGYKYPDQESMNDDWDEILDCLGDSERLVEMYYGEGSDSGTWFTDYVEIPLTTADADIVTVAINAAIVKANQEKKHYAFIGVYNITQE